MDEGSWHRHVPMQPRLVILFANRVSFISFLKDTLLSPLSYINLSSDDAPSLTRNAILPGKENLLFPPLLTCNREKWKSNAIRRDRDISEYKFSRGTSLVKGGGIFRRDFNFPYLDMNIQARFHGENNSTSLVYPRARGEHVLTVPRTRSRSR